MSEMFNDGYPPKTEALLIAWAENFLAKTSAAPASVGLLPAQCTLLGTLLTNFKNSWTVANDPATRSPMNLALKNAAKKSLVDEIRLLGGIVQSFPGTTNAIRVDLGLPQRTSTRTRQPRPGYAPGIEYRQILGRRVLIRLKDTQNPLRRGRPLATAGAAIFSYVGETKPTEFSQFKFEGNVGRVFTEVVFPSTVPAGATVWLSAFWFNDAKESGPACEAVSCQLGGMGSMPTVG